MEIEEKHEHDDKFKVVVHYVAAIKPFMDDNASRDETLQSLKERVLKAFGLKDGEQRADGTVINYQLYQGAQPLGDRMNSTLGQIAGEHKVLQLNLSQEVQQG